MKTNNITISFYDIFKLLSTYRTELMGIGILGVLFMHTGAFLHVETGGAMKALQFFATLVFTDGFLLLSGLGLYFSMHKNGDTSFFYRKRIRRLLIPFMLMAIPFFLYSDIFVNSAEIVSFVGHTTSLAFWFEGNYCGMWYIALSMVLYLLFPIFFHGFKNGRFLVGNLLAIAIFIGVTHVVRTSVPGYYQMTEIALNKIPIFFIGSMIGWLLLNRSSRTETVIRGGYCIVFLLYILFLVMKKYKGLPDYLVDYYMSTKKVVVIPLVALAVKWLMMIKPGQLFAALLHWFGKYTLEIYVLHLLLYVFLNGILESRPLVVGLMVAVTLLICKPVHELTTKVANWMIR